MTLFALTDASANGPALTFCCSQVLLTRCQLDGDDEVRDRATYFKAILDQHQANLNSHYILNG